MTEQMRDGRKSAENELFRGDSEMSRLMRAHDWAATPVGPVARWPRSLQIVVRLLLDSRYAMWLGWGPDFTFFYNDAYARMSLGAKHPWALGRSAREVWAEIWDDIGPRAESVVRTGAATWDERLLLFLERRGFLEETYHTFSYSPVQDDQGGVGGMLCVVTEDTERVIGERRLRTLRELGARTSEEARSAEDACRAAAHTLAANPHDLPFALLYLIDAEARTARLAGSTGLSPGAPAAPASVDLTTPQGQEPCWPLHAVLQTGQPEVALGIRQWLGPPPVGPWPEMPHTAAILPVRKSGQERLGGFLVAGVSPRRPFDDDYRGFLDLLAGQIASAVGNARAYEEERRRAEALAELDRAKTAFFSNVSHEFRTPLTLMLGPVEDLLARPSERLFPENRELLEVVHRNGLRLQKLVNTLLDFSRIEAGRVHACYEPTDLAAFTAELASCFRSACQRAGLELVVSCPPLAEPVYVDREMWEKIVLNLLSNAFKFTLQGRIEISLRQTGPIVELAVRDTGVGIPAEEMSHLFERFHRVEEVRGRTQEGSGIGLALVRELVHLHGGEVRAESTLGQGSTFRVTLPLGTAHLPPERIKSPPTLASTALDVNAYVEEALRWLPSSREEAASRKKESDRLDSSYLLPASSSENRPRILLADDNTDMREYIARLLAARYQVTAVANGLAARDTAFEQPPDLVLTDVMMPGLDGFGLLRELRAHPETAAVPVLLLSARAGEEASVEGLKAGADDYLTKPFSARELLSRVQAHLELAKLRRESAAALRQSEERFRGLMEQAPFSIQIFSPDGHTVRANRAWEELWGVTVEQIADYNVLHDPQLESKGMAPYLRRAFAGEPVEIPPVHYDPNETIPDRSRHSDPRRWVSAVAYPLKDAAGHVREVVLVHEDITARKHAEEELQRSEQQSRRILESITDAFFALDRSWRFTYVNRQAEKVLDRQPGDLLGKVIWEEYPGLSGSAFEKVYHQAMDGQTSLSVTSYYPDHQRWYEVHVYPSTDGISVYFRDATERHRLLDQLETERQRLQAIVENVPAGIVLAEAPSGRMVLLNRQVEKITGQPAVLSESIEAYRQWVAYHPNGRLVEPDEWALARTLRGEVCRGDELLYQRGDGTRAWIRVSGAPIRDGQGVVVGGVIVVYDIDLEKRTEAALREAEQRWRSLAEALPNLVWTDTPDGQCDYLSSQWGKYTGIPEQELLGLDWLERVLHPDDRERTLACWLAAVADRGEYDLEYRIRRHDGQYRWFKTRGVPLRDEQGRIVKWFGTCTDIEDQKQAVEELRRSQERFRQLADAMPQIVFAARPDGRADYLNRRWYEYSGQSEGEAGDQGWLAAVHPDDRAACLAESERTRHAGIPFEMELRLREGRSGQYRWHLARSMPVRDAAGHIIRWYGTSTDIHERKRTADASRFLADASATLASVVDYESTLQKVAGLAVPYFADWSAVDVAGEGGTLRRLAVFHQSPAKIRLVQALEQLYPPDPDAPSGHLHVFRTGKPEIVTDIPDDMLVKGARDEQHLQLLRGLELRSYICVPLIVSGRPFGVLTFATAESARSYSGADLALAEDLAHRAAVALDNSRLYAELRQADRLKDEFLAMLAHELRNPLAPVRNALHILKEPHAAADMRRQVRDMAERQVQHMARLLDDLLDVSRISRGRIELRKEAVDVAVVVQRTVEAVRALLEERRHQILVQLPPGPLRVDADPTRLEQVLTNLLNNAAKYTDPGGRIRLAAEREDGMVVMRVQDNGIGIAPAMLPRIFDLFVQAERRLDRSQGGVGIGLTLVKRLVELHGGRIEARSAGLGQGSEFVVRLPAANEAAAQARGQAADDGPVSRPGRRVLVVDDNPDAADSLALLLQLAGQEVRAAYDGARALALVPEFRPELIFLDIGMPGMDGYEVVRRLRLLPGRESMAVVALTGWGQDTDRQRSAEAGFDHHLVKPVEPAVLQQLLDELPRTGGSRSC